MPPSASRRLVLWITFSASLLGALFAHAESLALGGAGDANAYLHGALVGLLIGGTLSSLEMFVLRRAPGAFLRHLPFLLYLGLRWILYLAVILIMHAAVNRLVPIATGQLLGITRADIVFSLGLSLGYNLLIGVNELLGPGVLFAFVAGSYHRPRLEERVLLFIDMRSSTAIAERLGEVRFLVFLNRFITDLSLAIAEAGGEIHKYVGDEVIATWKPAADLNDTGCVRACFAALDRLGASGPAYEREFGFRADFRAGWGRRPADAAKPTAPTLDQFLAGLRTAWKRDEVAATARQKEKVPRLRRRPDPFAAVDGQLHGWFEAEPWRTSRQLFERLQTEYAGIYPDGQLRTLQRRVKAWRREMAQKMVFGTLAPDHASGDAATRLGL